MAVRERGRTQTQGRPAVRNGQHRKAWIGALAVLLIAAAIPIALRVRSSGPAASGPPMRYLGLYERSTIPSYAAASGFTAATGVRPNMLMYYSAWNEPFRAGFAAAAARHGAVTLVQMNPSNISLAAIAAGRYDGYLSSFASAVRAYHRPVILSFGHEMNGHWYSWAYMHTSPVVFVAAWRHIVTLFRSLNAANVTWLWTVNIIQTDGGIPSPQPWWPGSSYVNWVGIDGYYNSSSSTFSPLFGATIATVHELTHDPILIAETGVKADAGQPAKIPDLFASIRLYGLLGFVWFQADDWRLSDPAAIAAFRQGAQAYARPAP